MRSDLSRRCRGWLWLLGLSAAALRAEPPVEMPARGLHLASGQFAEVFVRIPSGAVLRAEAVAPGHIEGVWLDWGLTPVAEISVMTASWTVEYLAPPPTAAALWCWAFGPLDLALADGGTLVAGAVPADAASAGARRPAPVLDKRNGTKATPAPDDIPAVAGQPDGFIPRSAAPSESSTPATVYVHADLGCDAWDGRALWRGEGLRGPKRTIAAAIQAARDGDRIAVLGRGCLREKSWRLNGKRLYLVALDPVRIRAKENQR